MSTSNEEACPHNATFTPEPNANDDGDTDEPLETESKGTVRQFHRFLCIGKPFFEPNSRGAVRCPREEVFRAIFTINVARSSS
jgi:hypothetical protein